MATLLKFEKEVIYKVDYSNFEDFVKGIYPCPDYCFCATQEASNDSVYRFDILSKEELKDDLMPYELKEFEKIKIGKITSNSRLLKCLVYEGYLEGGIYMIEVCY